MDDLFELHSKDVKLIVKYPLFLLFLLSIITCLPNLPKWEILALSVLMQSIVLLGTVNANFFKKDRQYQWFLAGFATYDMLMNACNFFYGYDPTVFTQNAALPQVIIGITNLGIRTGFTVTFPLATVFFAALVKKMRANK